MTVVVSPAGETRAPGAGGDGFHNLQAYIPGDRRLALLSGAPMPDRVQGAALFADISGFTALTEALAIELGPQRGAEVLTANLNRVFHALISELEAFGGHVIYFSGDAITCWFDADDGARATTCALAMQRTMAALREVVTPAGSRVPLAMKAAVATGSARRFLVGDPDVQQIDVLAGRLIDALATAERLAQRGEVLLDAAALDVMGDAIVLVERRSDPASGLDYGVVESLRTLVEARTVVVETAPLPEEIVRRWVLPSVYDRLRTGQAEFLAELRPAYPMFIRFGGIDYDNDDDAITKLDAFVRGAQRVLATYGGNLLHLTLGDKGAYLYAVFGPPLSHEDDAARAASAALELRDLEQSTSVTGIQIGITYGRLRSGTYGHARRQAFTCLGDAVNLSARLMASAPPGHIYATETVRHSAGDGFVWEELSPITVKGKVEPVAVHALAASKRRASRNRGATELPIVGRLSELDAIVKKLDEAIAGHGAVAGLSAEAGMGKSRLVSEVARTAVQRGAVVAVGECQPYGTHTSYFVWRSIWSTLFRLDESASDAEQVSTLQSRLAAIDSAFVARAPLLGGLLDLPIPDNDLTAGFDAKLRKTSLEGLLVECLRVRSREVPLALVLEDCHWLDPLSRDLLDALSRAVPDLRVMIVVAYRPAGSAVGGGLGLDALPHFHEIALRELDDAQAAQLIRSKLAQMMAADVVAPAFLVDLVTSRAQGNPLYIEELLSYIRSQGVDSRSAESLGHLRLPDSLHSLVLSRIDTVAEAPRRTLKVASVVGRVFRAPTLPGVYPDLGTDADILDHLGTLGAVDLVRAEIEAEQSYMFRHTITQEVAYESIPFSFRSALHERVGAYIERTETHATGRQLDLLAHHYWHSDNVAKKREYLARAGDAAQAAYANAAAIDYFERLATLVEGADRVDVLLKIGKVLELVGNWRRAEEVDTQALALATTCDDGKWLASCETALAEVSRKQGRFDDALARLDRAARGFEAAGDEPGVGLVKHLAGTVAAQRGDYPKAVESYEQSLAIRERLDDKVSMGSLLSNLGIVAEYRGDYEASRRLHERALDLRTAIGDRRGIGNSTTNLGMIALLQKRFDVARDWFQKSMALNREIGDVWMVALCDHNLANAVRKLGDYAAARRHYAASLRAYRGFDDAWALSFLLEDVGILVAQDGEASAAHELLGAADAVRAANDMPRAPSRQHEIELELAEIATSASAHEQDGFRERGRTMTLHAAVEHALAACAMDARSNRGAR